MQLNSHVFVYKQVVHALLRNADGLFEKVGKVDTCADDA